MRDPLDDLLEPTEEDLFSMDEWLAHGDGDEYEDDMPSEVVIRVSDVIDGATSLQEVSDRLYDYADELLNMFDIGWDLVETMSNGQGVAILLDERDSDDE